MSTIIEQPESSDNIDFYMTDDIGTNVFYSCMPCGDPGTITLEPRRDIHAHRWQ